MVMTFWPIAIGKSAKNGFVNMGKGNPTIPNKSLSSTLFQIPRRATNSQYREPLEE
jgi:hypothetical protein